MRFYSLLMLLFLTVAARAQSVADHWYFGDFAAIEFSGGAPVALNNSAMKIGEGCASWSDEFGNLLFYTKGDTVWDASHNVMQDGTGLLANGIAGSASQSAIIIPRPNSTTDYYLFTLRSFTGGVVYSRIDMTLNGGLGGVVVAEKNVPLAPDSTLESMTIVRKPNNLDYWFVTLRKSGDEAYAYEVTSAGVNTTPVVSNTGFNLTNGDQVGYLRASQQNDKLALTIVISLVSQINGGQIYLFDFDGSTGQVSFDLGITPSVADSNSYGVEFSPNGQFLYSQSSNAADLRQYDLTAGSAAAISASEVLVGAGLLANGGGALQLGPDGVIYACRNAATFLAAVLFPDQPGALCGYNHDGVSLNGEQSVLGLPQFPSFLLDGQAIMLADQCFGDSVQFTSTYPSSVDEVLWTFGDPTTGVDDTSALTDPKHLFSDTGTFTVRLIAVEGFLMDTSFVTVTILPLADADLGPDTTLCAEVGLLLNVDQPQATYLWSDGSTDSIFLVSTDTMISVTVFGFCDTASDTITVNYSQAFAFNLVDSLNFCAGNTAELDPSVTLDDVSYIWSTPSGPSSNDSIFINQTGTYIVTATNGCAEVIDTVEARFDPIPFASLPDDTTLCQPDILVLTRPDNDSITYTWSDSSSTLNFRVDSTSVVWLAAENDCGFSVDTFRLIDLGGFQLSLGPDTQVCPDDTILLNMRYPGADYLWSTGQTSDTIWTNAIDDQYSVTVTLDSCAVVDRINLQFTDVVCESIDCRVDFNNVFTPNGDGWNDNFRLTSDCEIVQFDLRIYSRWGQLVHQSSQSLFGWDGFIAGEPAPEGVYFFVLEFRDEVIVDVDRQSFQGSLTLLR